jgi:hypothetical protein
MSRIRTVFAGSLLPVAACLSACHHSPASPAQPPEHALSGLAAQHVVILPTYVVHVAPGLGWSVPRLADLARTQDADIAAAFDEHAIKTWILPADLESAYKRNSTYASDPHTLAEEPLRSPSLAIDDRLPEPIASQLRTIVALHDDARLVLAPVDLRLESAAAGFGHGVLRLVLVDARASAVRWIGEITSDPVPAFSPSITASIASKLSAVIAP